jgi:hypothetical protein
MAKAPAARTKQIAAMDPAKSEGALRRVGGSGCDDFNNVLINQACQSPWTQHSDEDGRDRQLQAVVAGLMGVAPRDELEGMLAAQMLACHNAAMECYRRAMIGEQTFEGRRENLNQANRLSRTQTMLMDALSRYRGKGQQKVTVEHVHVHAGGQAIVGAVEHGGGVSGGNQGQPHAKQLAHAPEPPLWGEDAQREPVPLGRDGERALPDARG